MLICHENMRLVEGERGRENIFWNQFQTAFGVLYHIYLNRAKWRILSSLPVSMKLRVMLTISLVRVNHFSCGFSCYPGAIWCNLSFFCIFHIDHISLLQNHVFLSCKKTIFCAEIWRFSTINFHNLAQSRNWFLIQVHNSLNFIPAPD